MTLRALARILGAYVVVFVLLCAGVHARVSLDVDPRKDPKDIVATAWQKGEPIARAIVHGPHEVPPVLEEAVARTGVTLVHEAIVAEGPILTKPEIAFAMSLVPAKDGVAATLHGETAYVTPDEMLARQAYDKGINVPQLGLQIGADVPWILATLADRLKTTVPALRDEARFRRVRFVRSIPGQVPPRPILPESLALDDVRASTLAAARYLARGVDPEGRFRYLVDAPTNKTLSGYDWPRHAGATYFLAQAASMFHDPMLKDACLRAARMLRDKATVACGAAKCIGTDPVVEIGSSSLALLAFAEIAKDGLDSGFRPMIDDLSAFLRSQQRADGELMHEYDREHGRPRDVQYPYFSGEATLALSRAFHLTKDARDQDAASRALAHLVGAGWSFFGDRYYWGEEHWTCQAVGDLWDVAPDAKALDFCLGWSAWNRRTQYRPGETEFDADGAFGVGPVVTPRLTPVASRTEAAVATLEAARKANVAEDERAALEDQIRRSLALLMRHQLRPDRGDERAHLLADPGAVDGALPGSPVDWQLRIDYAQHAGSAMVRWIESNETSATR